MRCGPATPQRQPARDRWPDRPRVSGKPARADTAACSLPPDVAEEVAAAVPRGARPLPEDAAAVAAAEAEAVPHGSSPIPEDSAAPGSAPRAALRSTADAAPLVPVSASVRGASWRSPGLTGPAIRDAMPLFRGPLGSSSAAVRDAMPLFRG